MLGALKAHNAIYCTSQEYDEVRVRVVKGNVRTLFREKTPDRKKKQNTRKGLSTILPFIRSINTLLPKVLGSSKTFCERMEIRALVLNPVFIPIDKVEAVRGASSRPWHCCSWKAKRFLQSSKSLWRKEIRAGGGVSKPGSVYVVQVLARSEKVLWWDEN